MAKRKKALNRKVANRVRRLKREGVDTENVVVCPDGLFYADYAAAVIAAKKYGMEVVSQLEERDGEVSGWLIQ